MLSLYLSVGFHRRGGWKKPGSRGQAAWWLWYQVLIVCSGCSPREEKISILIPTLALLTLLGSPDHPCSYFISFPQMHHSSCRKTSNFLKHSYTSAIHLPLPSPLSLSLTQGLRATQASIKLAKYDFEFLILHLLPLWSTGIIDVSHQVCS